MKRSEALKLRRIIETSVQSLEDNVALQAIVLYPKWTENITYTAGFKVRSANKLWRCIQAHTSIVTWKPENTPALWAKIDETHSGAIDDPIPYDGNMVLVSGLYYVQGNVIYRCTTNTINPVYHALHELIGLYVEEPLVQQ